MCDGVDMRHGVKSSGMAVTLHKTLAGAKYSALYVSELLMKILWLIFHWSACWLMMVYYLVAIHSDFNFIMHQCLVTMSVGGCSSYKFCPILDNFGFYSMKVFPLIFVHLKIQCINKFSWRGKGFSIVRFLRCFRRNYSWAMNSVTT